MTEQVLQMVVVSSLLVAVLVGWFVVPQGHKLARGLLVVFAVPGLVLVGLALASSMGLPRASSPPTTPTSSDDAIVESSSSTLEWSGPAVRSDTANIGGRERLATTVVMGARGCPNEKQDVTLSNSRGMGILSGRVFLSDDAPSGTRVRVELNGERSKYLIPEKPIALEEVVPAGEFSLFLESVGDLSQGVACSDLEFKVLFDAFTVKESL